MGELQEILEQSQPRVSRHLRLLDEAGLVQKFRDGHWVYYRLATSVEATPLLPQLIEFIGTDDPQLMRDRSALSRVKQSREKDAYAEHGSQPYMDALYAGDRPSGSALLDALDECLGDRRLNDVLDIGSGNRRLALYARRAGAQCHWRGYLERHAAVGAIPGTSERIGELHGA